MSTESRSSVPLLDAVAAALRDHPSAGLPVVALDEFLARPELDDLVEWVVDHEQDFAASQVISPSGRDGVLQAGHRRSKVLFAPGPLRTTFEERLMSVHEWVCRRIGMALFPVRQIEIQITASNDGEFFRAHTDNGHRVLTGRRVTYVYFFNREPTAFAGGRLRFFETSQADGRHNAGRLLTEVVPRQNRVVFFPSHFYHEIETVRCPSRRFVDSRFTVNGWYRTS